MKATICGAIGTIGSALAYMLGGWDSAIITLLIFMGVDYITGLILAGIFHKSTKTKNGAIESKICWKGLCKKLVTLFFIIIANRLDILLEVDYIKNAVCIAFIVNELISITENAGLMGIPIPKPITKAIEYLVEKEENNGN